MINSKMRFYPYYLINSETDAYGQQQVIKDADGNPIQQGTVKLNINIVSQSTVDNIKYNQATYIGLTSDQNINESYIIQYNAEEKLKVLYVNPLGRLRVVYLGEY